MTTVKDYFLANNASEGQNDLQSFKEGQRNKITLGIVLCLATLYNTQTREEKKPVVLFLLRMVPNYFTSIDSQILLFVLNGLRMCLNEEELKTIRDSFL